MSSVEEQYINKTSKDFKVGQVVCRADEPRRGHSCNPRNCEVTKVGRKWVYVSSGRGFGQDSRFDPSDPAYCKIGFPLDGGDWSSPGTIYLEEKHYQELARRSFLDDKVRKFFGSYNSSASLEQLEQIAKVLDLDSVQ